MTINSKKAQSNKIIEWAINGVVLLIFFYIFFQIAGSLCQSDKSFCKYSMIFIGTFAVGIYFYLKYGWKR